MFSMQFLSKRIEIFDDCNLPSFIFQFSSTIVPNDAAPGVWYTPSTLSSACCCFIAVSMNTLDVPMTTFTPVKNAFRKITEKLRRSFANDEISDISLRSMVPGKKCACYPPLCVHCAVGMGKTIDH